MLAETAIPIVSQLSDLGVAGLMGAMWLWERRTSRQREQQLDEAHGRIVQEQVKLEALVNLVQQTAQTLARLEGTQQRLVARLDGGRLDGSRLDGSRPDERRSDGGRPDGSRQDGDRQDRGTAA